MLENVTEAFNLFLSFENVAIVFLGVLIGTVVGAIPGMTTPMGVALVLPFTFTMNPVTGILLLLGVYKGGLYGGSITAILLKAPERLPHRVPCLTAFPWRSVARRGVRSTSPCTRRASPILSRTSRSSC